MCAYEAVEKSVLDCVAPQFWRAYVVGYTAPAKIGSRLARTVFERPPGDWLKNPFWTALLPNFGGLM
jgi:hypothetical protein